MNQEIPWTKYFIEAFVIIGSILFAFAIDAWWAERQMQESKIVLLESLLDDMILKQEILTINRAYNDAIENSSTVLLTAASEPEDSHDNSEIEAMIAEITWSNSEWRWTSAPLESLIMGGNASIALDPLLLQELASVQLSLSSLRESSRDDGEFISSFLLPFLYENARMPQLRKYAGRYPGNPDLDYTVTEYTGLETHDHRGLLLNPEFQNLLDQRIMLILTVNRRFQGFDEKLAGVIALIHDELGE